MECMAKESMRIVISTLWKFMVTKALCISSICTHNPYPEICLPMMAGAKCIINQIIIMAWTPLRAQDRGGTEECKVRGGRQPTLVRTLALSIPRMQPPDCKLSRHTSPTTPARSTWRLTRVFCKKMHLGY